MSTATDQDVRTVTIHEPTVEPAPEPVVKKPTMADIPEIPAMRVVSVRVMSAFSRSESYISVSYPNEPASAEFQANAGPRVWAAYRRRLIAELRPGFAGALEQAGLGPQEAKAAAEKARFSVTAAGVGVRCPGFVVPRLRELRKLVHIRYEEA